VKIIDVRVPFLGTNDDIATVVAVNQSSGSFVERGIDLFCIETTKSVISVPAEQEGYCYHSLGISDKVRVGQLIGCIADRVLPASEFKAVLEREALGEEASVKRFTDKALKLARFMRLTREIISANPSSMIINTELVEAYAASIVNEFSLQEKKLLEGCCSDSTGLVIVGNGHGNRALGMHINAAHNKKVKVFLDYSNKLKPRSSESAIEAPIFLGNRFIENCSGLLVHVPYEILVELKPYLDVANPPFFSFIHPNATVAPSVKIGRSVSIMAGAVIEPGSIINGTQGQVGFERVRKLRGGRRG